MTALTSASRSLAPSLVGLGTVLAAGNWYLQPERAWSWAAALLFLGCLALLLGFTSRRAADASVKPLPGDSSRAAVVCGALIIVTSLSVKLAQAMGLGGEADLAQRLSMVVFGAVLVLAGNVLPKMLTPLSVQRCNGTRAQAVRRFSGWAFVLAGLAFALAWLILPPDIAEPVSVASVTGAALAVIAHAIRPWRRRPRQA